jgi:hypothetical protein
MTARPVSALLLAASLMLAGEAHAQRDTERARRLFIEGQTALEEGRFTDAVRAFRGSLAVSDRPGTMFNLGLAYRGLDQCREAQDSFEQVVGLSQDDALVQQARTLRDDAARCVGHVSLTVAGRATEVLVDGEAVRLLDGQHDLALNPGHHTFEARREGHTPARASVDLARGARDAITLDAGAWPLAARIVIDTGRSDVSVRLNGEPVRVGAGGVEAMPGRQRVEVQFADGDVQRREVDVPAGGRVVLAFTPGGESDRGGVHTRWWFWTGIGAVVVGAVVGIVAATGGAAQQPVGRWATVTVGP